MTTPQKARDWFMPLSAGRRTLGDAVHLGFVSDCVSLSSVDLTAYDGTPLGEVRVALGIEEDLLRAYYAIERRRFPDSPESQRLLD